MLIQMMRQVWKTLSSPNQSTLKEGFEGSPSLIAKAPLFDSRRLLPWPLPRTLDPQASNRNTNSDADCSEETSYEVKKTNTFKKEQ